MLVHEQDSEETTRRIEKLYFQNSSIYLNSSEQRAFDKSKNEFMRFLERDEREALKMDTRLTEEGEESMDTKYKWPFLG